MKKRLFLLILAVCLIGCVSAQQRFELISKKDTTKVCKNPHKGLYHHYYDNGDGGYLGTTAAIDALPGCDIIFIRLAWRYFEPTENNYNWSYIDNLVSTYQPKGYKFAFAFTCKETGEQYATPQWVKAADAKGTNVDCWGTTVWEPDYGDPIFLAKLQKFHTAVAARYNSAPWLAFVQIASYGTWGEGHNYPASEATASWTVLKQHVDMYTSLYTNPKTKICWVDDSYEKQQWMAAGDQAALKSYCDSKGIFWSDHSVMVKYYLDTYPSTYSIQSPVLFTSTWQTKPTQLEMQHYHMVKNEKNWSVPNGTTKGASIEINAVKLAHCTWFGFHGDAKTWVADNPIFSKQISNLVGYWYKLNYVDIPQGVSAGSNQTITLNIENIGVAPAYNQYQTLFKLTDGTASNTITIDNSNNKAWMPGIFNQNYQITIPLSFANGTYDLYFKMYDNIDTKRNIDIALNDAIKDADGFFKIGTITIGNAVGISESAYNNQQVTLYPNPTDNEQNI